VDFSRNKDVKNVQRHLVAAVVVLNSKSITPKDYADIMEFVKYVEQSLSQHVRALKPEPKSEDKAKKEHH